MGTAAVGIESVTTISMSFNNFSIPYGIFNNQIHDATFNFLCEFDVPVVSYLSTSFDHFFDVIDFSVMGYSGFLDKCATICRCCLLEMISGERQSFFDEHFKKNIGDIKFSL